MARPPSYWHDIMLAEKGTLSVLSSYTPNTNSFKDLLQRINNASIVAFWELLLWPVAVAMAALDSVFDFLKIDLEEIARRSRFGSEYSYINAAREFQYGDNLVWDSILNEWKYPEVNLDKRIAKYCAIDEDEDNVVIIKVAQKVGDVIQQLDAQQLQSFEAYMGRLKPKGIAIDFISQPPDVLQLAYTIIFDPLVLTDEGEMIDQTGVFPVEDAINNYITSVNEGFKGIYNNDEALVLIKSAKGVVHAYLSVTMGKEDGGTYSGAFAQFYKAVAGYMTIDTDYPLSATLVYNADV